MTLTGFYYWIIPSCFAIAMADYFIFSEHLRCASCTKKVKMPVWYAYVLPSFIEILLFLAGIGIGSQIIK